MGRSGGASHNRVSTATFYRHCTYFSYLIRVPPKFSVINPGANLLHNTSFPRKFDLGFWDAKPPARLSLQLLPVLQKMWT